MSQDGIAYGQALYSLAAEAQATEEILGQLSSYDEIFRAEEEFYPLLSAPNLPVKECCDIVERCIGGGSHPYVLNTLKLMIEKRKIRKFPECVREYRRLFYEEHQIVPVTVVTVVPLTQMQIQRLSDTIAAHCKVSVEITNRVEPDCIGGVKMDFDGKRVDGTVASVLESIENVLKDVIV